MTMKPEKIILAVTGASGSLYGKLLLERLGGPESAVRECAVVFSATARQVWQYELGEEPPAVGFQGTGPLRVFDPADLFAPMASGSAGYECMIVVPCSMGTLGRIAAGISNDLITRAADVMLKERRRLILVPRETPYSLIHLNNMKTVTEAGAILCPASPSFYSLPATVNDLAMTVVDRVLSLAGFSFDTYRWGETPR